MAAGSTPTGRRPSPSPHARSGALADSIYPRGEAEDLKYKRGAAAPDDTRFSKIPRLRDRYVTPRNEEIVEKLQAFAQARGHSMLELAFSWLAGRPQVSSVIAGATRVEQVEQNVKAIGWSLGVDDVAEIDRITMG